MSLIYDAPRFGLKGSAAAAWPAAQGIAVPPQPNRWPAPGDDRRIPAPGRRHFPTDGPPPQTQGAPASPSKCLAKKKF